MLRKMSARMLVGATVLLLGTARGPAVEASLTPGHTPLTYQGAVEYSPNGQRYLYVSYDSFSNRYILRMSPGTGCGSPPRTWDSWTDATRHAHCGSTALGTHTNQIADATYQASAELQSDGNFVLYTSSGGTAVWTTNTSGHSTNPQVDVQDDFNLVVYENGTPIWSIF